MKPGHILEEQAFQTTDPITTSNNICEKLYINQLVIYINKNIRPIQNKNYYNLKKI